RILIPDIADYHLPMFGGFHNCAFVAIRKAYPLQARRVMHSIWGAGQMAWTKLIIVVDDDVNVHDESAVLATTDYGTRVIAIVQHENITATQFHPEKSGALGLKIYENFIKDVRSQMSGNGA
ncbi:MAG: UbiD family decarboxylase, partial [Chloroflexi bacterium]|nr:UbiD family decarboxylase [Chloroflexota bacterium]